MVGRFPVLILCLGVLALAGAQAQAPAQTQTLAQPIKAMPGKHATDEDRQVLEALLLDMQSDKDFPVPAAEGKPHLLLHERTPKRVDPLVNTAQVMFDTGNKVLPKDAWDNLITRNVVHRDPNSREVRYDGLPFDEPITVGNAYPDGSGPFIGKTFQDADAQARAWVEAWVPGYSKDHKTSIVRARFGPAGKWATVTAILRQQSGKWSVVWKKYSVLQ